MDTVTKYMNQLMQEGPNWAQPLKNYAKTHRVPIIDDVSLQVVLQWIRLYRPKRILEIGTAIGYSALRINDVCPDADIITIEKDEQMYSKAIKNISRYNKQDKIHVIHGDAIDVISTFPTDERFDFVFIDAAKSKYDQYVQLIDPHLNTNGLLIADNILFRNYVIDPERAQSKRFRKIAEKLHAFNEKMMQREDYHTSILPVGDGLLCSIKLN